MFRFFIVHAIFFIHFTFLFLLTARASSHSIDENLNQAPTAVISTTSPSVVLVGSEVSLDASLSSDPESQTLFYEWSFVEKPGSSMASFLAPSAMESSFHVDQQGLYVIRLRVRDNLDFSEPKFFIISAVQVVGDIVLPTQSYSTPLTCAVSVGAWGCEEETTSFRVITPGNYILNLTNRSLRQLSLTLNSESIVVQPPPPGAEIQRVSIPVTLLSENILRFTLRGAVGSSLQLSITSPVQPEDLIDNNSAPIVPDLFLDTPTYSREVSGFLSVSDTDSGQTHHSEIIKLSHNGFASLSMGEFSYTGLPGFRGLDIFYVLTRDNGNPVKAVVSKVSVMVNFNTAPQLKTSQVHVLPKGDSSFPFNLFAAIDSEEDPLTYEIVERPSQVVISDCLDGVSNDISCNYTLPQGFTGDVTFSYRASDGLVYSGTSVVTLKIVSFSGMMTQVALGNGNSCVVFDEGHIRCWGYNAYGSLGFGHGFLVGDDENPLSQGDVNVGESVSKLALGENFNCALLKAGGVKCWGYNYGGVLGLGEEQTYNPSNYDASFQSQIDFGTTVAVKDIVAGGSHICALFETGQMKCWGYNGYGRLGYGHTQGIGDAEKLDEIGFVDVGGRVISMDAGITHTCVVLEGGGVKCWGYNFNGQLGLGHTEDIGDDEVPSSIGTISLGEVAVEVSVGYRFSCARLVGGGVKCWGDDYAGALGLGERGDIGDDETPQSSSLISLGGSVDQLSSGDNFSCALMDTGQVRCWGENYYGQLGLGHTDAIGDDELPSSVSAVDLPERAIQIATGNSYACALLESGKLLCWGRNSQGELGLSYTDNIGDNETLRDISSVILGEGSPSLYPRFSFDSREPRVSSSVRFDASDSFSKSPIQSYSWDFGNGEFGSGEVAQASFSSHGDYIVRLTLTDSLGQTSSIERTVRVRLANDLPLMPQNQRFTLEENKISVIYLLPATDKEGNSLTYHLVDSPIQGSLSDCLGGDDDLSCQYTAPIGFTGKITFSYRANDGTSDSLNVTEVELNVVSGQASIWQLISKKDHTCALFDNHKLRCWGSNRSGQLGLGHTDSIGDNESPLSQDFVDVGANVLEVSLGHRHTCALLEDKSVKCWGESDYGVLGPGIRSDISDPSLVEPLDVGFPVKQITSGNGFNCVLGESGQVKCWGYNRYGQLGLGHDVISIGDSVEEKVSRIPFVEVGLAAKKLSAGSSHVCALLEDKSVKCWGDNQYGRLGLGYNDNIGDNEKPFEAEVVSLGQGAIDISAGTDHTCALLEDKNIKCWGRNYFGQLGLGFGRRDIGDDELPSSVPVVDFVEDVKQVLAAGNRTCALFNNGDVRCWGHSIGGLLGYPVSEDYSADYISDVTQTIVINTGGVPVQQMALGSFYTCLGLHTGEVRCFGYNNYGQLGLGHTLTIGDNEFISERNSSTFSDARSVVLANFDYSVSETDLRTLGFNASFSFASNSIQSYHWDFGDGEVSISMNPSHQFSELGSFNVTLRVVDSFGQEATTSQYVVLEGDDRPPYFGKTQKFTLEQAKTHEIYLGNALDLDSSSLTYSLVQAPSQGQISNCLDGTDDLVCSYQAPAQFVGEVEFSYKANDGNSDSEVSVVKLNIAEVSSPIVQLDSGWGHTCALYENKRVRCWGSNLSGELGLGHRYNIGDDESPLVGGFVDVGAYVEQISLGNGHTCAILGDQSVKCWGENSSGQLGLGHRRDIGDNELPSSILSLALGEPIRQVGAGGGFTCALTESGQVKCWGGNYYGQLGQSHQLDLGDSFDETSSTFTAVKLGARATKISVGTSHACALLAEGRVRCWGHNNYGQLGYGHINSIGDDEHPFTAGNVSVGQKVLDIAAADAHTCALLEDRSIKCWGHSDSFPGQSHIGDDELPSSIGSLDLASEVQSLRVGWHSSCALMMDGGLKCWGDNYYGQLGQGTNRRFDGIVNVPLGEGILDISLGAFHALALMEDGSLKSWGRNNYGHLGLGHNQHIGDNESIEIIDSFDLGGVGSPITARFIHSADTRAFHAISFDASSSYSRSSIGSYSWDFGDASLAQLGQTLTHTFAGSGSYTVTLTVTDSLGQVDTFSQVLRVKMPNRPPFFNQPIESFIVYQGETATLELANAEDSDQNTSLTYTLVEAPNLGILSHCLGGTSDLICDYIPDSSSTDGVEFTYKANDGAIDSEEFFTVLLDVRPAGTRVLQVSSGILHTCVLYENKKVSCSGDNHWGQLGLADLDSADFIELGEAVARISSGDNHSCTLMESGDVRCWGSNSHEQLGMENKGSLQKVGDDENLLSVDAISFEERVIQVSAKGDATCVLLENEVIKCWGEKGEEMKKAKALLEQEGEESLVE